MTHLTSLVSRYLILAIVTIGPETVTFGQQQGRYRLRTLIFYNLENLFDLSNDSLVFDDDRTPAGKDRWTRSRYLVKIANLSRVLSEVVREYSGTFPDLVGICEVENQKVVEDLVGHPNLISAGYGIIHEDSPDERGIDVALLYKRSAFSPRAFRSHRLLLFDSCDARNFTRDLLVVSGKLDGEEIHLLINHWPSRSGGKARSDPYRKSAAELNLRIIDSLEKEHKDPKIVVMGDLNDSPLDYSLKRILRAEGDPSQLEPKSLFNPMEMLYKQGAGSLAYRDSWSLFDQILFTSNMVRADSLGYRYLMAGIYAPAYLRTRHGRFKGYPLRTYSGGQDTGGFSDHFPVFVLLIRKSD